MALKLRRGSFSQKALDKWFPTLVRYLGVGLLVYAAVIDRGRDPALIPAAAGMILFKSVYNGGPPRNGDDRKE